MSPVSTKAEERWPGYALPRGTTVNGYLIERILGSGGFGITYLAHDLLRQPFAIKEYFPRQFAIRENLNVIAASSEDVPLFEECRERFMREAQALVMLGRFAGVSDGIARVYTYFEAHHTCFLVMDYIKGATLASVLHQKPGGLSEASVHSLLCQLLSSIRTVHQAGLMHRDIKPANIIMREDDSLVLIDFGSSRPAARGDFTSYTQIYSGSYAPPEQRLGHDQGEFSDIYAIGAVCYRAIGGEVVDALVRHNALVAGKADPQLSAAQIGAGRYPRPLLALIDAALATDPAQRPQTADAMLAVLVRDAPAEALTIVAPGQVARGPPLRRLRGVWPGAAAASALAVAGLAYLLLPAPAAAPPAASSLGAAIAPQDQPPEAQPRLPHDAAQRSTAESGQLEAATASKLDQPPPIEQPPREAILVPPPTTLPAQTSSLPQIAGEAGKVSVDGYLIVDEKTVHLTGVAGISADKAANATSWIRSHGGHLECQSADGSTYRCLAAAQKRDVDQTQQPGVGQEQKIDVAQALLLNGAARATPDAAPLYRDTEAQARAARRGLWR